MSLLDTVQTPDHEASKVECYHQACLEQVAKGDSVHFSVGISHYHKEKGFSYIQVHEDMLCCSPDHAAAAAHARIDTHKSLQHGVYDQAKLNPAGAHADSLVRQNAEYSDLPRAYASLPKVDALTHQALSDEVYIPHVDFYPGIVEKNGTIAACYQAVLQALDPQPKSLEQYDLGSATLDGAIQIAHQLVDEIKELVSPTPAAEGPGAQESIELGIPVPHLVEESSAAHEA